VNSAHILERKQEFLDIMQQTMQERHYSLMLLMLTDVLARRHAAHLPWRRGDDPAGLLQRGQEQRRVSAGRHGAGWPK